MTTAEYSPTAEIPPTPTSVILVVKGAGIQKPDETQDVFLNGFWPAVKSLDPHATMRQRHDIFPSNYRSSPHDTEPHNHVTEICSGNRRIWIKEAFWEADLVSSGSLTALVREWRMATYAFASTIYDLMFALDSRRRGKSLVSYFVPFAFMYWLVLVWPMWISVGSLLPVGPVFYQVALVAGLALLTALIVSISPALETQRLTAPDDLARLPAMANWVLFFLVAAFLLSPGPYLLGLAALALAQVALLRARAMAWPFRQFANSDTDTSDYYSFLDAQGGKHFGQRDRPVMRLSQTFYRYIVVLGLPLTFLVLTVARLLKWTRVLGGVGEAIEQVFSLVLSSVLGDVVTYAMDAAQAHQVRCAVETDLQFFHHLPEVSDLHIFAHSQGTPITFETLFHQLPDEYRSKIKTYVTIGSVLSYYHQANPVLDSVYIPRFPVRPYPTFADGFKWMNFWNLADPITEFYGLDEYNLIEKAPPIDPNVKRHTSSPTNIKTRATLQHHSEYWGNLELVQRPFAKRVLGIELRPIEWAPQKLRPLPAWLSHQRYVILLWALWTAIFFGIGYGLYGIWQQTAFDGFRDKVRVGWDNLNAAFARALPDIAMTTQSVIFWLGSPEAMTLHYAAVLITLAAVMILIVISVLGSLLAETRKRRSSKAGSAEPGLPLTS